MKKIIGYTWLAVCTCTLIYGVVLPICIGIYGWVTSPSHTSSYQDELRYRENELKGKIESDSRYLDIDTRLKVLDMIKNEHDITNLTAIERTIKYGKY
jgi:hypothetical protein